MNQTSIKEIILLGFLNFQNIKTLLFTVFLIIYSATLLCNLLIIVLVYKIKILHFPMYLFLKHLSICDVLFSTSIAPVMLSTILHNGCTISFTGCMFQLFLVGVASITEGSLLTVMSYDRYLAICKPLHYSTTMTISFCLYTAGCCWTLGFSISLIYTIMMSNQYFCGPNVIDHIFCDFAPLLKLSCSDTSILELVLFIFITPQTVGETLFILTTYVYIALSILQISSTTGRGKAFSTCSSHLTVVSTYYGTIVAVYMTPSNDKSSSTKMMLSLLYTMVTPLFNPIIYSLRNKEIQTSVRKLIDRHIWT